MIAPIGEPTDARLQEDLAVIVAVVMIAVAVEGEQVHEIADGRTIFRNIPVVVAVMFRVLQIVPAPIRDSSEDPSSFR